MGSSSVPEDEISILPFHLSPLLNSIYSPGRNFVLFILSIVFHAVPGVNPSLLSLPSTALI